MSALVLVRKMRIASRKGSSGEVTSSFRIISWAKIIGIFTRVRGFCLGRGGVGLGGWGDGVGSLNWFDLKDKEFEVLSSNPDDGEKTNLATNICHSKKQRFCFGRLINSGNGGTVTIFWICHGRKEIREREYRRLIPYNRGKP